MDAQPNDAPAPAGTPPRAGSVPAVTGAPTPSATRPREWRNTLARWWSRPLLRRTALAVLTAGLVGAAVTTSWWMTCGFGQCPTPAQLRAWRPSEGGALLGRDSGLVSALSLVRRVNVPLARVPDHVQRAFIAVEDRRFYQHHGVDWYGVVRAVASNLRAGGVREGASTITMQLARNVFLGTRAAERSWGRKLLEWRYAQLLERALTKQEILERYLNAIYLGNGVYGIEAASRDLFGRGVTTLTLADAALLAGLPKAPSTYSPRRSRDRALARRAVVLEVLLREGVADSAAMRAARAAPLKLARREFTPARPVDSWAVEAVRATLDSLRQAGVIPPTLSDAHLRVWSTIDRRAQLAAERAVSAQAAQIDDEREWSGQLVRGAANRTQGALVALDPATGAVRAIVGGRRIERKGFNRAFRSKRQPGSTFKPFVYAAALQQGFTTASMIDDEPVEIGTGRTIWRPTNYGDDYAGRITLRDALARSANAATVRISREVGVPRIADLAHAQGITSDLPLVPALALGAASVTPLELTAAYAPFANGGLRVSPYLVQRIEDPFGTVLWQQAPPATRRVLDAADAFLVTSLLQGVVDQGTGGAVRSGGIRGPVAGKTGTTNDGADVWFVGYTPTLVAGVWFGADAPQPLGWNASGGRLAAPAWARFLREGWHTPEDDAPWLPPPGIESRRIDISTGKLASDWCGPSRREYFRAGTAPTESCESDDWQSVQPPDWHDGTLDVDEVDQAVRAIMDATDPPGRVRRATDRVLRAMKRAVGRGQREDDR